MALSDERELVQGTHYQIRLTFTSEDLVSDSNPDGRVDLSGTTVYWWMKRSEYCEGDPAVFKDSGSATEIEILTQSGDTLGQADLFIIEDDTSTLSPGTWKQEAQVLTTAGTLKAALSPTNIYLLASGSPLGGPAPPAPGFPANQGITERSFKYTLPSDGDSFSVTIPGSGMYDTTYAVEATISSIPAGAPLATPYALETGRTQTSFTLEFSGTLKQDTVVDIIVRDS